MIYIVGSYYVNKEEWIVVKNKTLTIEEMTNVVGALANLHLFSKFSKSEGLCPPIKLQSILCEKFESKERKHKYKGELESIYFRIQPPMLHTTFVLCDELIIWIDVKEAMDYTQGRMWSILNSYLQEMDIKKIQEMWREE